MRHAALDQFRDAEWIHTNSRNDLRRKLGVRDAGSEFVNVINPGDAYLTFRDGAGSLPKRVTSAAR
jgi:hypothetical protein